MSTIRLWFYLNDISLVERLPFIEHRNGVTIIIAIIIKRKKRMKI